MKLNYIEKALMNNPIRAFFQRHHEAAIMQRLGGRCEGKKVLEIGCGRGVGTEIIFERFGASEVHAFDLDPKMIEIAQKRLIKYPPEKLRLFVGDAERIEAADNSFDAVFDFGIIHHIPNWEKSVSEISRVLRPGGYFYFEEVTARALNRWFYRTSLEHPKENRFSAEVFVDELERKEIIVGNSQQEWFLGDLIIGVGRRI
ncbi:MAG: class I SAM-dependent methyltransferase [Acidobacteria bacterium]|nr:MAG: class I SAM-dependent methyltransferase [Acidobacteriota bacterium]REJ98237.1 MAG: class I SAM-dependent methyltransferase [Acidobacteriota bacterium]REK16981.1 MAG: class I SAM-dependent methyltransferase [Acidobacteriota bacterium]REK42891.1 MAG: class I SAM-dependent methyltransferase [Acidobacteriota bacterium]